MSVRKTLVSSDFVHSRVSLPATAVWPNGFIVDLSNRASLERFRSFYIGIQNLAQKEIGDLTYFFSHAFARDLSRLINSEEIPGVQRVLRFIRFDAAISPLLTATGRGNVGEALDWAVRGLVDDVVPEGEFQTYPQWVTEFAASTIPFIVRNLPDTINLWSSRFFYWCWRMGAYPEIAAELAPVCWRFALKEGSDGVSPQRLEALIHIAQWAALAEHPLASNAARRMRELTADFRLDQADRQRAVLCLAGRLGNFTPEGSKSWCQRALSFGDALPAIDRFVAATGVSDDSEIASQLPALADGYSRDIAATFVEPVARLAALDQRASVLGPAVFHLGRLGRITLLTAILQSWYGVPENRRRRDLLLLISPTHGEGGLHAVEGCVEIRQGGDATVDIEKMTTEMNATLGTKVTVRSPSFKLGTATTPDKIAWERGRLFAALAIDYLAVDALLDFLKRMNPRPPAILFYPGAPLPLQSLMVRVGATTLPIAVSLETPLADRQIRKVGIWNGESDVASEEIAAIAAAFAATGVEIELHDHQQLRSPQEFERFYQNSTFDILWVVSHGHFDSGAPANCELQLRPGSWIGLDRLATIRLDNSGRRLLVLNFCSGAAATQVDGLHRLGIAPMLTRAEQATIAHQWDVKGLAAAVFGAILAIKLADGAGYFEAYERTLSILVRSDAEVIVRDIERLTPRLATLLRNRKPDFANILLSGSSAFFE